MQLKLLVVYLCIISPFWHHREGIEFEHNDTWVPKELNNWWERLQKIFLKWFYVLTNIKANPNSVREGWRYFLNHYHDKERIKRLVDTNKAAGNSSIRSLDYRTVNAPKSDGHVNRMVIKKEVEKICTIYNINQEKQPEVPF